MSMVRSAALRRFAFGTAVLGALTLASPAISQEGEVSRVIAIQVYAEVHGSEDPYIYGVAPENEPVYVSPGQRLRLTLVGTGLIDGEGEEIEIPATFNVASGPSVDIIGRGDNWVDIAIRRNASGVAGAIGYRAGSDYPMRNEIRSGRIVLEVEEEEE